MLYNVVWQFCILQMMRYPRFVPEGYALLLSNIGNCVVLVLYRKGYKLSTWKKMLYSILQNFLGCPILAKRERTFTVWLECLWILWNKGFLLNIYLISKLMKSLYANDTIDVLPYALSRCWWFISPKENQFKGSILNHVKKFGPWIPQPVSS